jgi:hypothetical protein
MTPPLPTDFLMRVSRIIAPFTSQQDDREALIDQAFFLYDLIAHHVELDGKPHVFRSRLIKQLMQHGCMPSGDHSVARLLETVKPDCGVEKHAEIDTLMHIANTQCAEVPAATAVTNTPTTSAPVTTPPQSIETPRAERQPTVFISYSHDDAEMPQEGIARRDQQFWRMTLDLGVAIEKTYLNWLENCQRTVEAMTDHEKSDDEV